MFRLTLPADGLKMLTKFLVGLSPLIQSQVDSTKKFNRCQCENCIKEKLGVLQLKPGEKRVHVCPFANCGKLYGKTSHLKVVRRYKLKF